MRQDGFPLGHGQQAAMIRLGPGSRPGFPVALRLVRPRAQGDDIPLDRCVTSNN